MGLKSRWQHRWDVPPLISAPASSSTIKTLRLVEAIELRHAPAVVWALVQPAESSVFLSPEKTARAFTVPGTGPGLGEQQAHINHNDQITLIEIIEFEEGRRAVTQLLSPKPPRPARTVTTVEPLGLGSVLTIGMEFDGLARSVWSKGRQDRIRDWATTYLDHVRRVLDAENAPSN